MLRLDVADPAGVEPLLRTDTNLDLEQAELEGLKARGREEIVAELEELLRAHGLQDLDLVVEELLDLADAGETVQGK